MSFLKKIVGRFVEILVVLIIFAATLPFFLLAILLIQIDSPGPVFLKQKRVGKGGRLFNLYKLRTMKEGADGTHPMHTQVNDPRFSKMCRFIRATTLDEIPQLINVLKGDMSIIGPRPERPQVVDTYSSEQKQILDFVPGLFGISQLAFREGVVIEEKLKLEVRYYRQRNSILDAKILLYTPLIVVKHSFGKLNGNSNGINSKKWVESVFIRERPRVS
jgi:lipopolysaccharide/colanic/teichoic acid biosynthesis glycosyltransferase